MSSKLDILRILEQNKGDVISGNEIAERIGITRSAVGKAIGKLREQGYNIQASTRNGYSLNKETDLLSKEGIIPFLSDINKNIEIYTYDTVDSTNQVAKKLAIDGAPHGTLVTAVQQTAGRGRQGRSFFSPPKSGIYMSIIIKPTTTIDNAIMITTATSVAVCRAIKLVHKDVDPKIKWVNDVYVNGKKICGILTEAVTSFESGTIDSIILGIGINIIPPKGDFPDEIKDIATSLFDDGGGCDKNKLIAEILNQVLACFQNISDREFLEEYRERSFVLGEQIDVITIAGKYQATAVDIDQNGGLIIKDSQNKFTTLNSGEISIRRITR